MPAETADNGMVRDRPMIDNPQPEFTSQDFAPKPVEPSTPVEPVSAVDVPEPEPPRRGSTVREPAPIFGSEPTPGPTPRPEPERTTPTVSEEAENADKPRRTGWWARRMGRGS